MPCLRRTIWGGSTLRCCPLKPSSFSEVSSLGVHISMKFLSQLLAYSELAIALGSLPAFFPICMWGGFLMFSLKGAEHWKSPSGLTPLPVWQQPFLVRPKRVRCQRVVSCEFSPDSHVTLSSCGSYCYIVLWGCLKGLLRSFCFKKEKMNIFFPSGGCLT